MRLMDPVNALLTVICLVPGIRSRIKSYQLVRKEGDKCSGNSFLESVDGDGYILGVGRILARSRYLFFLGKSQRSVVGDCVG